VRYDQFTHPPCDAPLIEAYGSRFESLYIVLHPFVAVPEELSWHATRQYPSDDQIIALGEKLPWATVARQAGIADCSKLSQALLTLIGSLPSPLADPVAASTLQAFLAAHPFWMPTEGRFEPLLQMDFLAAFEAAGHEELIFVPEFPRTDPIQHLNIAALRARKQQFPSRGSLVAPDASFLFTVDWDSFFTLFYGPHDFVAEAARTHRLEGFFATPTTEHLWFNYSFGCCVVTLAPETWSAV
jgi:hypothetical protein